MVVLSNPLSHRGDGSPEGGKGFAALSDTERLGQKQDSSMGLVTPSLGLFPLDQVSFPCSEAEWRLGHLGIRCTSCSPIRLRVSNSVAVHSMWPDDGPSTQSSAGKGEASSSCYEQKLAAWARILRVEVHRSASEPVLCGPEAQPTSPLSTACGLRPALCSPR